MMSNRLGIFLVVTLAISEGLGQNEPMRVLLPVCAGETILRSSGGRPIKLPYNQSDAVAKEVQEPHVRALLLQKAKLPADTPLRYMIGTWYEVQVSTFGLGPERAGSFATA